MSKKKVVEEEKTWLGRPGNNLSIGIVGLPNIGKTLLFNVLTNSTIAVENFPFSTTKPETARVQLPDERWESLCEEHKPEKRVPAWLTVHDVSGLVKGSSENKGLGNAFLSHISACDGIYHLVRAFKDDDIIHVEETVDPVRDLGIVHGELLSKDLERCANEVARVEKELNGPGGKGQLGKQNKVVLDTVNKVWDMLKEGKLPRYEHWTLTEVDIINKMQLLTAKPVIYLVNLTERDFIRKKNKWLPKIKAWVDEHTPGDALIPVSCVFEQKLHDMPADEAATYQKEHECKSMTTKIVKTGYTALNLINFFTTGPDEVRAWTIRRGSKAPQAAGVIHSDFERGFICAETMKYDELRELGITENEAKTKGVCRLEGKNYVVQDGDIILFKFNVTSKKKK